MNLERQETATANRGLMPLIVGDALPPSALQDDPILGPAFALWAQLRTDRPMPLRSAFDPMAIPSLLPHVVFVHVRHEPLDFQFRVIGAHIEDRMGARYGFRWASDLPGKGPGSHLWSVYARTVAEGRPQLVNMDYVGPVAGISGSREIYLPFGDGGGTVSHILVVIRFVGDTPVFPRSPGNRALPSFSDR